MSEAQKKQLEQQLWNIANTLRGKMDADEFRDYILGFIFYKYLSEKMEIYADSILKSDGIKYKSIDENFEPMLVFQKICLENLVSCKQLRQIFWSPTSNPLTGLYPSNKIIHACSL